MATVIDYIVLALVLAALTAICTAFVRSRAGRRLAEILGFDGDPEWMKH